MQEGIEWRSSWQDKALQGFQFGVHRINHFFQPSGIGFLQLDLSGIFIARQCGQLGTHVEELLLDCL